MFLKRIEYELDQLSNILSLLLPDFVIKRVKNGIRYIAEDKGVVTVIFCDIYEFDKILEDYNPNELISLLDEVFEKLDKLCDSIGITKIETVGKTYLACAGLKDSESETGSNITSISHSRRAVDFGLAILNESSQILLKNGEHLKFKIGINSGPVTAGVVGLHKPQFSLVGDTVNTASRMASTLSEPHAIQISSVTFSLLENTLDLSFVPQFTEVKGKGIMETMLIKKPLQSNIISSLENFSYIDNNFISSDIQIINSLNTNENFRNRNSISKLDLPKQILRRIQTDITKHIGAEKYKILKNIFCRKSEDERIFESRLKDFLINPELLGLVSAFVFNLFMIILESIQIGMNLKYKSTYRLIIQVLEEVSVIVMLFLFKKYNRTYTYALYFFYSLDIVAFFLLDVADEENCIYIGIMYFYFRFLQVNFCGRLYFSKLLLLNAFLVFV